MTTSLLSAGVVALLAVALAVPSQGLAQSHRKARAEKAIAAFTQVCATPNMTRREFERRAKASGTPFSRPGPDPTGRGTVTPTLGLAITTDGKPVQTREGLQYWSCGISTRGQFFAAAATNAQSAMKRAGFKRVSTKTVRQGQGQALLERYRAGSLDYDLIVYYAAGRTTRYVDYVAGTSLSLIARPRR